MKENPNASFGEVSKNVASMWKALGEQKNVYKERAANAKADYEKALAASKASRDSDSKEVIQWVLSSHSSPVTPTSQLQHITRYFVFSLLLIIFPL
jgi:hypothetical protein